LFKGIGINAIADVSLEIKIATDAIKDFMKENLIVETLMSSITWVIEKTALAFAFLTKTLTAAGQGARYIWKAFNKEDVSALGDELERTAKEMDDIFERLVGLKKEDTSGVGTLNVNKKTPSSKGSQEVQKLASSIKSLEEPLDSLISKYEDIGLKGNKIITDIEILTSQYEMGRISLQQYNATLEEMGKAYANLYPALGNQTKELTKQMEELKDAVGTPLERAFMDSIRGMMDGALEFGDVIKNMIKDIVAEMLRVLVVKKLVGGITGLFGASGTSSVSMATSMARSNIASAPSIMATTPSSSPTINIMNYGNDNVRAEQNGDTINITIAQIASDISRGKGPVGKAIESRYGVRKI
jgi:hypothetical protein